MVEVSCAMVVLEQSTISRCLLVQKKRTELVESLDIAN